MDKERLTILKADVEAQIKEIENIYRKDINTFLDSFLC